jgi:hypothetical protein
VSGVKIVKILERRTSLCFLSLRFEFLLGLRSTNDWRSRDRFERRKKTHARITFKEIARDKD